MEISDRPVAEPDELPRFLAIARALTDDIRAGRLPPGARLPGTRSFAQRLGVHRNTVLAAYAELAAEGWIETRPASGTFVSSALPETDARPTRRGGIPARPGFALRVPAHGDVIDAPPGALVMSGVPDLRLVPAAELARAYRRAVTRRARAVLGYADPRGAQRLRRALAAMLVSARGLPVGEDDVLITRGSQMALDLCARTLLCPGDVVAVEALGYPPAWQALARSGARLVSVPVDAEGIDVVALARLARQRKLRAVYVTPHHQFPTTVTLTPARRLALLELARRRRFAIIEDDYDHELHYEWRPVLPLASADGAGVVVYVGTLSKLLAPGLRLGYLVAPRRVLEHATQCRLYLDRQGDHALEHAVAELIEDGELGRHTRRAHRIYAARRDALVSALGRELGGALSLSVPSGGMSLWARVARGIDVEAWSARARERGVVVFPGKHYAFDRRARPRLRLGYAALDEDEIAEAVRRLAAALP